MWIGDDMFEVGDNGGGEIEVSDLFSNQYILIETQIDEVSETTPLRCCEAESMMWSLKTVTMMDVKSK